LLLPKSILRDGNWIDFGRPFVSLLAKNCITFIHIAHARTPTGEKSVF